MTNPLNKYKGQIVQSLIENNEQEMSLKPIQAPQQAQPVQPTQDVGIVPFDVPQAQKQPVSPVQQIQKQPIAPVTAVQPLDYDFTQGMNTPLPVQPIQPIQQQQFTQPGDYTKKDVAPTNEMTQDEASYILERGLNTVGQWINLVPQIGGMIGLASTDTKRKTESLNMLADQLERSGRSREEVLKIRQEARKATKVGAGLDKFWSDVITYEIVADSSAEIEKKYEGKVDAGTKILADVSSAALDMLPQTAIAYFSGGTYAMAYVFASSAARSTKEGLQLGATPDEAQTYGILNGAIEVGTEILSGGWAGVPKGKFTGLARQGLLGGLEEITLKIAKSDLGKKAISMAYQYLGEGAEEYLAEVLGNWAKGVIDPNMVKPWDQVQKDAAYAGLVGALTSVVMDVGRVGGVKIAERSAIKQMEEFNTMTVEEQVGYATALLAKTDTDLVFADEFEGQAVKGAGMMVTKDGKNTVVLPTRLQQEGGENILTLSLVHEFTHTLEQKGIYNEFKSSVLKDLKKIGLLDALRQQKQALYDSQGVQLTAEEIDQEIVATFVQDNLFKRVVMVDGKPQTYTDPLAFRRFLKQMPKRQFNLFKNIARGFLNSHYSGELNESIEQLNKEYNAAIKANDLDLAEQLGAELSDLLQASNLVNPSYTKALELAFDQLVKDVEPAQQKRLAETTFKQDVIDKATPISQVNPKTTKYQLVDAEGDALDVNPAVLKEVVASAKEIGLEEKDLVAIHNVPIHKLMRVLDLGGFPMPSIAVTTDKLGHESFGEISVVFKPDVLEGSPTFWRDAYTPRFPRIYSGFIKSSDFNKFKKQLEYAAKQALDYGYIDDYDIRVFEQDMDSLKRFMNEVDTSGWRNVMERLANSRIAAVAMADMKGIIDWSNKSVTYLKKTVENNLVGLTREQIGQELLLYAGTFGASSYIKLKYVDTKYPNGKLKPISQLVMPLTAENVVQAMLTDDPIGAEGKTQAFNFDSLSPYVISVMKTKEEIKRQKSLLNRMDNNEFFKAIVAINHALDGLATTLAEIDRVKQNITIAGKDGTDKIMALSSYKRLEIKAREAIKDYFAKFGSKPTKANFETFMKKQGYDVSGVKINTQLSDFSIERVLIPIYLRSQNPNIKTITNIDYVYGQGIYTATVTNFDGTSKEVSIAPQDIKSEVSDILVYLISSIQSIVSPMFESKPQRVVGFDEIDTIVLPKMYTQNKKLMDLIEQNNINYQVYDLPTDRTEIVKSLSSAKFMLLPDENKPIPVPLKLDKATPISKVRPKNVKYQLTDANGMTLTPNEDKLQGVIDAAKAIGMDDKELMAIHNLDAKVLPSIIRMGGFPMPSIAVTKDSILHDNFGDVSVIFKPSVLEGSPTFWRDAWTATFPYTTFSFINKQDVERAKADFTKIVEEYVDLGLTHESVEEIMSDYKRFFSDPTYMGTGDIYYHMYRRPLIEYYYLTRIVGQDPSTITKEQLKKLPYQVKSADLLSDDYRKNLLKDYFRNFGADDYLESFEDNRNQDGTPKKYSDLVVPLTAENVVTYMLRDDIVGEVEYDPDFNLIAPRLRKVMTTLKDIKANKHLLGTMSDEEFRNIAESINDRLSNLQNLDANLDGDLLVKFVKKHGTNYNRKNTIAYFKKHGIDLDQTLSGLELYDADSFLLPKFIQQTLPDYAETDDYRFNTKTLIGKLDYYNKGDDYKNEPRTLEIDYKKEFGNIKKVDMLLSVLDESRTIMTPLFESKPQRVVGLDEIEMVVLNMRTPQSIIKQLDDLGIPHITYGEHIEGDRLEKVSSVSTAKFMLLPDEQAKPSVVVDGERVQTNADLLERIKQDNERIGITGNNLVALHNLDVKNLDDVLDLGGLPMPSIAVTKDDIGHTRFGNVTFVMNPALLNESETYAGDAWTPTFPFVFYIPPTSKDLNAFYEELFMPKVSSMVWSRKAQSLLSQWRDQVREVDRRLKRGTQLNKRDIFEILNENNGWSLAVGLNKGIQPAWDDQQLQKQLDSVTPEDKEAMIEPIFKKYGFGHRISNRFGYNQKPEETQPMTLLNIVEKMLDLVPDGKHSTSDSTSVLSSTKTLLHPTMRSISEIKKQSNLIGTKPNAFNFTDNIRGIIQLLSENKSSTFEYELDDAILDYVRKDRENVNEQGLIDFSKDRGFDLSEEWSEDQQIKNYGLRMFDYLLIENNRLIDMINRYGEYNEDDQDARMVGFEIDGNEVVYNVKVGETYNERKETYTPKIIKFRVPLAKVKADMGTSPANFIMRQFKNLQSSVWHYFESKPRKAIDFSMIDLAIVPNTTSKVIKDKLTDHGIPYEEYTTDEERKAIVNAQTRSKFMLQDNGENKGILLDEEILADGKTETEIREFLANQGFTDDAIETEIEQLKIEREQETEEPAQVEEQVKVEEPTAKETLPVQQPKVEPIPDDAKMAQRKHPVTAANSGVLDEAQVNIVQRDLEQGKFDYVVLADKPAIERANKSIGSDPDAAFNEIKVLFDSGRRFKKDDMVKAEVLIQAYAASKQTKKAMELLAMVAEIGTELGQSVQAMSVIKKMGAAGRLMAMDRVLKRLSKQYDNIELKISDELRNELLSKTDTKEMEDVVDKIKGEIAKQLPANFMDKLNAWRYLSMLGNPKTHIRNYLGNAIFWGVNKAKDSVGAALESVFVEQGKRTKTLVIDNKIKAYAKELFEEHRDEITGSGKYDINRDIESKKTIFKNKALEKARQLNFDWLEKEDDIYLRAGFIQALGQYMTAQGLTRETLTGKALDKAILVASEQAKKRTFRQTSNLATTLNNLEKDSKIGRFIIGSTVPFKKTPINILKAGYEFSPLGLLVNGISGINDVKNEKITPTEYIDRISAGLTGTGIALLGAWLYSMGLLTAGEDDEEGKRKTALERSLGFQRYSLRLGDWSVSLDWVAPAVMPLMIGAEMAAELNRKYDESILNIAPKALANIFNPAFELTMLQGVVEAMNTFEDGGASAIGDMFSTMASNYVTQFFPTVGGQMARTIDPTQRTTYSGSDFEGFLETTGRKILNKIPGGTYLNEPVVNIKGEEVKQPGDVWLRGIQQFLNPANIKENITDDTDREILRLFNQTGETSVIPPTAPSTFTYNGETIELGDGKTEYAKTLGSVSYNLLSEVFNHKDYDDLTNDIKAKVAADAYEYAVNGAKAQLLSKKGITFVNSAYTKILEAENAGIKVSDYLIMKNRFDTIKAAGDFSRKENILAELVYGGYTDDEIYNYLVYVAGYSYLSSDQKYIDILRGVR